MSQFNKTKDHIDQKTKSLEPRGGTPKKSSSRRFTKSRPSARGNANAKISIPTTKTNSDIPFSVRPRRESRWLQQQHQHQHPRAISQAAIMKAPPPGPSPP
jgi:hypothetical protein